VKGRLLNSIVFSGCLRKFLHFYILLQVKCKLAMPFGIPDRYREGRENWLSTTDTCKKVITWTASVAPCVVSADPVHVSSLGSILLEHIFHDVRSDSNRDDRSSRMMGFLHQLPKDRFMPDLGIAGDLHQGRHRSRSGLVH
jgi:hypothetical protein